MKSLLGFVAWSSPYRVLHLLFLIHFLEADFKDDDSASEPWGSKPKQASILGI